MGGEKRKLVNGNVTRVVFVAALWVALLGAPLVAQVPSLSIDASVGARGGAQRAAVSAWYPGLRLTGRLRAGVLARISAYGGDPTTYRNRGNLQGGLVSSLTIDPGVYALNGAVFGELGLLTRLAVGANLDLIGFATGPTRTAGSLTEKPAGFSYFRYGSADRGSLNSEFFVSLLVTPVVRVRAGLSHYVTGYTVTDTAASGAPSSRYQKFDTVPFVAVGLRL